MKPLTMARQELIEGIVKMINEAGLPAFVVSDILRNLLSESQMNEQLQLTADRQKWEEENALDQ